MGAPKSAFKDWFVAQFGKLPNETRRRKLSIKIHETEAELYFMRGELRREEWLNDTMNGALKAWSAKP